MTDAAVDFEAIVEETIRFVTVRPDSDGWVGDTPGWFGDRLFGGFVLAQAVHAATRTAPEGKRIHSLHGYFLRPMLAGPPVSYRVSTWREGRSFASRHLEAVQEGKAVFNMACSFTQDTGGYEYELALGRDTPPPEELDAGAGPGGGPWLGAFAGPTPPGPDGTMSSTQRAWFRMATPLPDDPHLHAALLAYLSDMTGTGGRPLHLEGDITGMVSLDHALWFHRPAKVDEWLLYDAHSLINWGGRGLLRGTIHDRDRRIVASVAQEMMLRPAGG